MVVKITSNHLISGPPLHRISFSCSGGMQNKAFQDKTPTPLHESDAMAPRPIGRHQVMRLTHVRTKRIGSGSCSTLGPEVRGGTQNAIIQKITERLSHHSTGQPFRNLIIFSQLRATEKPMFSEGGYNIRFLQSVDNQQKC